MQIRIHCVYIGFNSIIIFSETVMMHIVLGIGCVVIAAAVAIYFSMPPAAPPPAQHRRRNNNWQSNDNDDEEDYHSIGGPSNYTKKSRAFRPR